MSGNNLYYIYVDTKMPGAIKQLVRYFQAQVFNNEDCISVLCKYYKEIEIELSDSFSKFDIPFKFIRRQSDINLEEGKVIFYLFNAQSNCRLVSYRNLTHIFVTHGESHKLASVKPIIRIYDFVITSGMVGIERYLKSGIFTQFDVNEGKIIKLGTTFIGNNCFTYDKNSSALVYAPTWEGGVPEEDYCSINNYNAQKIIAFCEREIIKTIYIQQHPNLGHRIKKKKEMLTMMVSEFNKKNIKTILLNSENKERNPIFKFFFRNNEQTSLEYKVKYALTDISAMEVQFISKSIPCSVFVDDNMLSKLCIPKRLDIYYRSTFIKNNKDIKINNGQQQRTIFKYFIDYQNEIDEKVSYRKRIKWLCDFTTSEKKRKSDLLNNNY